MSGGSYSYFCYKVEEFTSDLCVYNDPKRIAFKKLMELVGKACHDIEWVDSGDYGVGDEHDAIDAVFSFLGNDHTKVMKAAAFDEFRELVKGYLDLEDKWVI